MSRGGKEDVGESRNNAPAVEFNEPSEAGQERAKDRTTSSISIHIQPNIKAGTQKSTKSGLTAKWNLV